MKQNLSLPAETLKNPWAASARNLLVPVLVAAAILPSSWAESETPPPPIPITVDIPKDGFVTLVIDDAQGNRVRNLLSAVPMKAGTQTVPWDGLDESLGVLKGPDGVFRTSGQLVAPGEYTIRGIIRDPLDLRYQMTVNSAGNPPWLTAGRNPGHGNWTSDHTPPSSVLFVPGATAPSGEDTLLIGSKVAEGGHGLIWTDLEGRKTNGVSWVLGMWTGAEFLARDEGKNATPEYYAYTAAGWQDDATRTLKEIRVGGLTPDGLVPVFVFHEPKAEVYQKTPRDKAQIAGFAVHNGLVVVSQTDVGQLVFGRISQEQIKVGGPLKHRGKGSNSVGEHLGTVPMEDPRGVAFDAQGRLLVLSGQRLLRYKLNPDSPQELPAPEVLVSSGLEDPQSVTLTGEGRILVSDWGQSHQVKAFAEDGQAVGVIGEPGGPMLGAYNPERMQRPLGIAVDSKSRLWVAENDFLPKRVSVWKTEDGSLEKEFFGPPDYGAGGELDPDDRTRFFYADWHAGTMEFALDWEKGTSRPKAILWRTGDPRNRTLTRPELAAKVVTRKSNRAKFRHLAEIEERGFEFPPDDRRNYTWGDFKTEQEDAMPALALFFGSCPETPIDHPNGKTYMTNMFNDHPTRGPKIAFLWRLDGDKAVPVAAIGDPYSDSMLTDFPAFASRWPEGISMEDFAGLEGAPKMRFTRANPVLFAWSDLNNNGLIEPEEVNMAPLSRSTFGRVWLSRDLSAMTTKGFGVKCAGFTEEGVPTWDLGTVASWADISEEERGAESISFPAADNRIVQIGNPIRGFLDGQLQWTYPNLWNSLHAGHRAPGEQYPGQLIATTKVVGYPFHTQDGSVELWPYISDRGMIYVLTTDGLFVDRLFQEPRSGDSQRWESLPHERDMSVGHVQVPGENFWPRMVQMKDGTVYAITGKNHSSIVRLDGLNSIRRLPPKPFTVDSGMIASAQNFFQETERLRQEAQEDSKEIPIPVLSEAVEVNGDLSEWAAAEWVNIDERTKAAMAIEGNRLILAYRTTIPSLVSNTGKEPELLFKSGGALDLMIGADSNAPEDRKEPAKGDQRLLVAKTGDRVIAMLYEQVSPGAKGKVTPFSSPHRSINFDRVEDVSSKVKMASARKSEDWTVGKKTAQTAVESYEVSIPLAVLGLRPSSNMQLRGDIGVLVGTDGVTTGRIYWSNKATGLIDDIPGEAMLTPALWGTFRFEGESERRPAGADEVGSSD